MSKILGVVFILFGLFHIAAIVIGESRIKYALDRYGPAEEVKALRIKNRGVEILYLNGALINFVIAGSLLKGGKRQARPSI